MSVYHYCLHCFADFLVHAFFHVTQCVIGQNSISVYLGLFLICPLPQESLRGRPKEIPHNEKLLSLKYEVNQSAHPQSLSVLGSPWTDGIMKPVKWVCNDEEYSVQGRQ